MTPRWIVSLVRLVGVALVLSAEGHLMGVLGDAVVPANHFSYFTILSNVLGTMVFALGLVREVPALIRGAATTYLVTTCIVYAVLLSGVDVQTPPYANVVMHLLMPFRAAVDWVLDPPRSTIPLRKAALWLAFPVIYLAYTLVRGPIADWYPYPFLDPRGAGGYPQVVLICVLVAVGIGLVAAGVWAFGNWRAKAAAARLESPHASSDTPRG